MPIPEIVNELLQCALKLVGDLQVWKICMQMLKKLLHAVRTTILL